jgi:hypothetical protein
LSKNVIQKELAFSCERSGSVVASGAAARLEILPRRSDGRGGASVVGGGIAAINRREDLNVEVYKKARNNVPKSSINSCCKTSDASQQR